MSARTLAVLAAHDWNGRVAWGPVSRSAALVDHLFLDPRWERVWWVSRVPPRFQTDRAPGAGFSRRLLRVLAKGATITQDVSTLENPAILEQLKETA